jgi:hypothetical protein
MKVLDQLWFTALLATLAKLFPDSFSCKFLQHFLQGGQAAVFIGTTFPGQAALPRSSITSAAALILSR